LSYITIIGIAGFAYVSNDFFDKNADEQAGKSNIHKDKSLLFSMSLLLLFLIISISPWFLFPFRKYTTFLLAAELFLFIAYALPPLRLKEKGFLGIVTDSLYAHTIPAILAAFTFQAIKGLEKPLWSPVLIALFVWQFSLGIRNILFHQIVDCENDEHSGINTFVTKYSTTYVERLLTRLVIPIEVLSFITFYSLLVFENLFFLLGVLLFAIFFIAEFKYFKMKTTAFYSKFCYFVLDDFYIEWMPIIILVALCFKDIWFLFLLLIHFIFFKNCIKRILKNILGLNT